MNRFIYIVLLLFPFIVIGAVIGFFNVDLKESPKYFFWVIVLYVPILSILRMIKLKYTWKEILLSFIPFYGLKYRFRIYKDK